MTILSPKTAVPARTAATMQRWVVILQAYNYEVEYRPSKEHGNVDALSRLPRNDPLLKEEAEKDISRDTRKDSVLARVFNYTLTGWSNYVTSYELKPYFIRRHELSVDQGCVLWGMRVITPPSLRDRLLQELHEEHPGVVAMKAIVRSYIWWSNWNAEIEVIGRTSCKVSQAVRNAPLSATLYPWRWPTRVWQRV